MSAPKFTPDPWSIREVANPTGTTILIEGEDRLIANVIVDDDTDRANGRLIAGAPVLYAALAGLQAAMACHDQTPEEIVALDAAAAALAKAVQP